MTTLTQLQSLITALGTQFKAVRTLISGSGTGTVAGLQPLHTATDLVGADNENRALINSNATAISTEAARATAAEALKAPLASPALTGTPTAPTQSAGDNSTKIATTGYADAAVAVETSRATTAEAALSAQIALTQGAVVYKGTWNASTNTPALASGTGTKGYMYKVSVAGTTALDGVSQWSIGDQVVFDGAAWDKIDGVASEVLSVAGKVGAITLASTDLTDAANIALISSLGSDIYTHDFAADFAAAII